VGPGALAARGLLAALAIGAAVELAPRAGPTVAAMAAVFPAIFLTTMLSLWLSQGRAVQAGAVGPMMLGASSVGAYALLAAITMPRLGPAAGAALAWAGAVAGVTAPAAAWLRRRA
jgi:Zn-dependent protease with chaperone function